MFPLSKRPLEFIAFTCIRLPTKEGYGYFFIAYDSFRDFIISGNVERDESAESVLKNIYFLTENSEFTKYSKNGFTLVLDNYQELSDRILRIIKNVNGKLMFDKEFNQHLTMPVIKNLSDYLQKYRR